MATLCMLHVNCFLPHTFSPLNESGEVGVSSARNRLLKAFGRWVVCHCKAGYDVKWNFANDIGLHRDVRTRSCALAEVVYVSDSFGSLTSYETKEVLHRTWTAWLWSRTKAGWVP
ncbi:hypothetical protein CDD83_950 [Cordyceps sp. RAO-2017]|nr:hypothetical protein CDD83_950 [Cordyceps sp. RAO-2017]